MPPDWPKARRINLHLNTQVTAIDRSACEVLLGTGEKLEYDRLILATGASAFVPPAKGADLPGCFVLREAADAQSTRSWRQEMQCTRAVVLGGGVLGVEAADSLRRLNLHTTIVQRSERLMDRELDEKGSAILRRFLDGLGMDVVTGASAAAILGEDRVREVELDNGSILPAEIFVACAGIRANTAIAVDAGLEVNRGVVVDDHMRTSDPKIFAVGDEVKIWPRASVVLLPTPVLCPLDENEEV